jgi:hypothetical protein
MARRVLLPLVDGNFAASFKEGNTTMKTLALADLTLVTGGTASKGGFTNCFPRKPQPINPRPSGPKKLPSIPAPGQPSPLDRFPGALDLLRRKGL